MAIRSVCVFCGASNAAPKEHMDVSWQLGEEMAARQLSLVYGGGDCGLMGQVANAVMEKGGWVTGVFPENLKDIENEHQSLSEIIIVDTMHTRKELMYKKSDVFVVLPGGFGTMDEMFEILTWKQLRLHKKPIILFNHAGYWDHLVALMDNIITQGFAHAEVRDFYQVVNSLDELLDMLDGMKSLR